MTKIKAGLIKNAGTDYDILRDIGVQTTKKMSSIDASNQCPEDRTRNIFSKFEERKGAAQLNNSINKASLLRAAREIQKILQISSAKIRVQTQDYKEHVVQ